nr:hypothetical protein [Tanacetum cinerariifolium]
MGSVPDQMEFRGLRKKYHLNLKNDMPPRDKKCMTRSLTKELFIPFKDTKREFRSSRKHFKTLSLDESRSPDFDLFSDQEEYSEEEVVETITETMEQYMSKTRADYGSGIARHKIEDNDNFEIKGQFLKELHTNTFSGSNHEDVYEHIKKVLEIEDLKTKFLSKYFPPARTAKKMEEINNFQQEPDENLYQAWERSIQAQLNNLGREIKKVNEKNYVAQVGCEQCKGPHHTKDCPLNEEGKTLEKAYYTQFGASVSVMPLSTYLNLGLGELAHTKLPVELAERTVKYPKRTAKNVLVEARLIGETLVLNRSLDPFFRDYIELNDLNVPLELRRDQVDGLMPTIKEGEVVEEFRARNDARMVCKIFGYPSDCHHDKKISIDYAYNLKFSCMIDFVVLEDMDAYRDEGMDDVIFGEPF